MLHQTKNKDFVDEDLALMLVVASHYVIIIVFFIFCNDVTPTLTMHCRNDRLLIKIKECYRWWNFLSFQVSAHVKPKFAQHFFPLKMFMDSLL